MNIFQFLVIALTVCLAPTSETMFRFNAVVSGLLILNESRQVICDGISYYTEPFNYLDIAGNVFIIMSAIKLDKKPGDEFYNDHKYSRYLILGILLVGLKAYSNLRIFESYRV